MIMVLFSISCNSTAQINTNPVFSYGLLSKDTLQYKLINPDKFKLIKHDSIQIKSEINEIHEFRYLVDADLKINYIKYTGFNSDISLQFRDKIEFSDREFIIDSFFYGKNFCATNEPRKSALNAVYKFTFSKKSYLCFYIQDITNPDAMLNTEILLFDITNLYQFKLILHETQASENLKCFSDFNKNNKLDFALWCFGNDFKDTLKVFELDENKNEFLKDEHHFMVIKDSMNNYYLDCKKSKWYFSDFKSLCR